MEKTLMIIKPGMLQNMEFMIFLTTKAQEAGFLPREKRIMRLNKAQASKFYEVHKDRPFFNDLVDYMSSDDIFISVLEKENAVEDWRKIIGATNPAEADPESVRGKYGNKEIIRENCVHGSDSVENALKEISFFFGEVSLLEE